jgi:outer membrane protein OmpU
MKKFLFASTALVMTTGMAAAQGVTLSGSAEMGVFDSTVDDVDAQFHTDIDVTFTMAGETDGGLTFGASIDLDESDADRTIPGIPVNDPGEDGQSNTADIEVGGSPAFDNSTQGGETIFISGGFGTVTMGDTDGAFDWAMTEVLFNNGSINDDEEHAGYSGNGGLDGTYDGQILRYETTFGPVGFAASAELDDSDDDGDPVLGFGVKYTASFAGTDVSLGAGYQAVNDLEGLADAALDEDEEVDGDIFGISASTELANGLALGANYSWMDMGEDDTDHFAVGVGYTTGAVSLSANYGIFNPDEGEDTSGFGVTAGYDLGGGAEVQFGYGYNDTPEDDFSTYSIGVAMSF